MTTNEKHAIFALLALIGSITLTMQLSEYSLQRSCIAAKMRWVEDGCV